MTQHSTKSNIEFSPTGGSLGLEVRDFDLTDEPTEETVDLFKKKLADHGLLVFHDQELSEEDHIRFTSAFGQTMGHPVPGIGGGLVSEEFQKPFFHLVNDPEKKDEYAEESGTLSLSDGTLGWHSDLEYMLEPQVYSVLYGMVIPPEGGDTEWCDLTAAYDALDEDMKQKIASLQVVRWFTRRIPQVSHPAVRTHPISGRKCLFVSPGLCKYIEGMDKEEGKALIQELSAHATQPRFCYVHKWKKGDVMMWDNRCTLHQRHGFDVSQRRVLRRCQTKGEPVVA